MSNVEISVYATGSPQDTGISHEQWRVMTEAERDEVIGHVIADYVDVTIECGDED